jgi:hypothetical protein
VAEWLNGYKLILLVNGEPEPLAQIAYSCSDYWTKPVRSMGIEIFFYVRPDLTDFFKEKSGKQLRLTIALRL